MPFLSPFRRALWRGRIRGDMAFCGLGTDATRALLTDLSRCTSASDFYQHFTPRGVDVTTGAVMGGFFDEALFHYVARRSQSNPVMMAQNPALHPDAQAWLIHWCTSVLRRPRRTRYDESAAEAVFSLIRHGRTGCTPTVTHALVAAMRRRDPLWMPSLYVTLLGNPETPGPLIDCVVTALEGGLASLEHALPVLDHPSGGIQHWERLWVAYLRRPVDWSADRHAAFLARRAPAAYFPWAWAECWRLCPERAIALLGHRSPDDIRSIELTTTMVTPYLAAETQDTRLGALIALGALAPEPLPG